MGKTQMGAGWLDPNKTSPFEVYQYWRNVSDADVMKCLKMLTFLPIEQILEMEHWEGSQLNTAKEILAHELTELVHGKEEADKAEAGAKSLFGAGAQAEIPLTELKHKIIVIKKVGQTPLKYPRKPGIATKTPIGTCYNLVK